MHNLWHGGGCAVLCKYVHACMHVCVCMRVCSGEDKKVSFRSQLF